MEQLAIALVFVLVAVVSLVALGCSPSADGSPRRLARREPPRTCSESGQPTERCPHSMHCWVDGAGYEPCRLSNPVHGFNGSAGLSFCQHGRRVWVC